MECVSIIVPIYRVEQYLDRCIESIINQTYKNIEIILVDDGSPDNCGRMCDKWAKKDDRIKVIHKENGGLSDARNVGLKEATGQYIAFVDSDDWVDVQYIELLLQALLKKDCDIVECNITKCYECNCLERGMVNSFEKDIAVYDAIKALENLIKDREFHQYVWNKIYKRELVKGIFFEKGKTNEDEFWTYQVFGRAKKIGHISERLYNYLQRDTSIMGITYNIKRLDALEAKCNRQKYIEEKYSRISNVSKLDLIMSCAYHGQKCLAFLKCDDLKKACNKIDMIRKNIYFDSSLKKGITFKQKIWLCWLRIDFWNCCRLRNRFNIGI